MHKTQNVQKAHNIVRSAQNNTRPNAFSKGMAQMSRGIALLFL